MTPKRFFYIMTATLLILIFLIIGSVVVGNNLLQTQSMKLIDLKTENKAVENQQIALIQARKDVEKYTELDNIAKSIVPQDKDQAKTIREITKIANESGIELKAITFETSNLGQIQQATPKPAEGEATTVPKAPSVPKISQVKPVDGINGVFSLQITISPIDEKPVPYQDFLRFLERLESNRRTAHVDQITVKPTQDGKALSFILTLNAYVKP